MQDLMSVSLRSSISGNSGLCIDSFSRNHPDDNSDSPLSFDDMLMSVGLRSSISRNSGTRKFFKVQFPEILVCVLIHLFSRNHPDDNSDTPVSFDNMLEIFNQLGIYIGNKEFKRDFWTTESFLKSQKPNNIKWQQAWKNSIKHYTPRVTPEYDNVPVDGVFEKWDPRLKASQIADVVRLYKETNEAHPATTVVKSQEAAESLREVVGMDIRFIACCDQSWMFPNDDEGPAAALTCPAAAGPPMAALPPAAAVDYAPPLQPRMWTQVTSVECARCPRAFPSLACPRLRCRQLQGTALCACWVPPLLHVPGGGGCVSRAGSSTLCGVPRTLSASCDSRGCALLSVSRSQCIQRRGGSVVRSNV